MPLDPPWIRIDSPGWSRPRSKTLVHTVKNVSGMAAACDEVQAFGHRQTLRRRRDAVLGVAAAGHQRADPVAHLPVAHVRRRPARWSPPPRGPGCPTRRAAAGSCPARCMTSGRLTPAAATWISTSPAAGDGVGRSAGTSTSGPPGLLISISDHSRKTSASVVAGSISTAARAMPAPRPIVSTGPRAAARSR